MLAKALLLKETRNFHGLSSFVKWPKIGRPKNLKFLSDFTENAQSLDAPLALQEPESFKAFQKTSKSLVQDLFPPLLPVFTESVKLDVG